MTELIKWCNENQGFLIAGLSLIAIFAAIGIPAYVAHRQNKIALFDKRFEVYLLLQKIDTYYHSIRVREFKKDPLEDAHMNKVKGLKICKRIRTPIGNTILRKKPL